SGLRVVFATEGLGVNATIDLAVLLHLEREVAWMTVADDVPEASHLLDILFGEFLRPMAPERNERGVRFEVGEEFGGPFGACVIEANREVVALELIDRVKSLMFSLGPWLQRKIEAGRFGACVKHETAGADDSLTVSFRDRVVCNNPLMVEGKILLA